MRHSYAGRKLKRTASHKRAMLANMATSLFEHKRVVTTVAKAKELRPFAEHLITRARNAHRSEKAGTITGVDVHNRRMVGRFIKNKAVLQELFDTIAPLVAERDGGYTRIIKLGLRRGDNAATAMIELVDWSNPVDGRVSSTKRRVAAKGPAKPKPTTKPKVKPAPVAAAPVEVAPAAEEVEDVVDVATESIDTPEVESAQAEAPAADAPEADAPADGEEKA
ncbi:MAG: 50S ribosomal protein L17 [Ignavibacteria bacterium]|nr:50S ribosomal protein L17 [Ignavibacteria bacterium]MBK7184881.1 50S ribosomal protein L17 [Ignavibacteria bacterium]MBK7577184.1 50S ribosomal protein L17 [Ignavibacteria bacterium]MBP6509059.1 50S ribosomal protein L17 [Candidatus Kapabacteria bacterium]MBP7093182.1 50S ribosomal protein L17 [Candidatus Kapabacteria bacterium]